MIVRVNLIIAISSSTCLFPSFDFLHVSLFLTTINKFLVSNFLYHPLHHSTSGVWAFSFPHILFFLNSLCSAAFCRHESGSCFFFLLFLTNFCQYEKKTQHQPEKDFSISGKKEKMARIKLENHNFQLTW